MLRVVGSSESDRQHLSSVELTIEHTGKEHHGQAWSKSCVPCRDVQVGLEGAAIFLRTLGRRVVCVLGGVMMNPGLWRGGCGVWESRGDRKTEVRTVSILQCGGQ